jgi:hypothetical protein
MREKEMRTSAHLYPSSILVRLRSNFAVFLARYAITPATASRSSITTGKVRGQDGILATGDLNEHGGAALDAD